MMYLGITLMFGSMGPMIGMVRQPPAGWLFGLFLAGVSGTIALGWAFMFQRRGGWFLLLIPLIGVPVWVLPALISWLAWSGALSPGAGLPDQVRRAILLAISVALLGVGFALIVRHIRRAEARAARDRAELALAAQIHASLVPAIDLRWRDVRVVGASDASGDMGGDLIDAIATQDRLDLFLADVSGHGVKAGVVMGMLKAMLRTALREGGDPSGHLGTLNSVLADLTEPSMFATAVWVRLERDSAGVEVASSGAGPDGEGGAIRGSVVVAGHPPVLRFDAAGNSWAQIGGQSLPLGVLPAEPFPSTPISLRPGDALVLYTDGLTEAADSQGRQLGIEGLAGMVQQLPLADLERARSELLASVRASRRSEDDQTIVMIRLEG